jgi:hypothetical protein
MADEAQQLDLYGVYPDLRARSRIHVDDIIQFSRIHVDDIIQF